MITDDLKRVWDKYACRLQRNNIDQERIAQNTAVIYDFIDSNADEINALSERQPAVIMDSERQPAVIMATEALIEMLKKLQIEWGDKK